MKGRRLPRNGTAWTSALAWMVLLLAAPGCRLFDASGSPFELAQQGPFPFQAGEPVDDEQAASWPPLKLTRPVAASLAEFSQAPLAASAMQLAAAAEEAGRQAESQGQSSSVDYYYLACAAAWQGVLELDPLAVNAYRQALGRCLDCGQRFGRLDPRRRLLINTPAGALVVPATHCGFFWRPDEFDYLAVVSDDYDCPDLTERRTRPGIGTPVVVFRRFQLERPVRPEEEFLVNMQPFAATAVLRPDLSPFLIGENLSAATRDQTPPRLEFFDPLRTQQAPLAGGAAPLAADFSAPLAVGAENPLRLELELIGFVRPGTLEGGSRLTMLEPYRPGAIPLVFVHGLLSSPLTWADMVNELRLDPLVVANYQFWAFRYSTGDPFLKSAAELRDALRKALATVDPQGSDAALGEMVLAGHSMGGLLSRLQITSSEDRVWKLWASEPLDRLQMARTTRAKLDSVFFFSPQPFVSRVIFLGSPHRGSNWATSTVGALGSQLVSPPDATTEALDEIVRLNPDAFHRRPGGRLIPTSIDMLAPDNPLLATMIHLPHSPHVKMHSIIGDARLLPLTPPGDGVVPVSSARTPGVESELIVPARHTHVHRHPLSILEVRRILAEHLHRPAAQRPGG